MSHLKYNHWNWILRSKIKVNVKVIVVNNSKSTCRGTCVASTCVTFKVAFFAAGSLSYEASQIAAVRFILSLLPLSCPSSSLAAQVATACDSKSKSVSLVGELSNKARARVSCINLWIKNNQPNRTWRTWSMTPK